MRSDMAQVLIERPRGGVRSGYGRQRSVNRRENLDQAPRREAIARRASGGNKHMTDLFGPLVKFLRSNVGRPWNLVFSEICRHARLESIAGQHLRRHVFDFVETQVVLIAGVPCHGEGWMRGRPIAGRGRSGLFVCPRTGLLRWAVAKPRRRDCERIMIDGTRQFHRIDGRWHLVTLRPIPEETAACFDALLGRRVVEIPRIERISAYGHDAYALSVRPVTKTELECVKERLPKGRRRRRARRTARSRSA